MKRIKFVSVFKMTGWRVNHYLTCLTNSTTLDFYFFIVHLNWKVGVFSFKLTLKFDILN